jgi:hypothetical protein
MKCFIFLWTFGVIHLEIKYYAVGKVPKSDWKMIETVEKLMSIAHLYDRSYTWHGTDTAMKKVAEPKPPRLVK